MTSEGEIAAIRASTHAPLRTLYDLISPHDSGHLAVSSLHSIYYEVSGSEDGIPVVYLHGGPGRGTIPSNRGFFDPSAFRIVLVDQRGAGRSTPSGCIEENTTTDLVSDLEKLREHLSVEKWVVFGGSWGSCLGLAYSLAHPSRLLAVVLRGILTMTKPEVDFYYERGGASRFFPDAFAEYEEHIPPSERTQGLIAAYAQRLASENEAVAVEAARHVNAWESSSNRLHPPTARENRASFAALSPAEVNAPLARITLHYYGNHGFFPDNTSGDGFLVEQVRASTALRAVPGHIIQARYDMVTTPQQAWALHKAWPEAVFEWVGDAGHTYSEPSVTHALVTATDAIRDRILDLKRPKPGVKATIAPE